MNKELKKLIDEVDQLRERVTFLEQQLRYTEDTSKESSTAKQTATASIDAQTIAAAAFTDTQTKAATVRYYEPKTLQKEKKSLHKMNEEKLAGTLFNRLGILAILVAAVFFFKWSFDNNLIGELGRIVIGIVAGLLFIGAGEYFQKRNFSKYAQGLTGGGIAILYFAIYSSFNFYHLISQPVAFTIMVLITLAASLLAIRYDAVTIGIIGIIGGFTTPFLISSNESNSLVLFIYIAILDVGVLLIAYYKKWPVFHYLTFLFTYASYTIANINNIVIQRFDTLSFSFLTLYFIIYLGISFTRNIRKRESFLWADSVLILLNGAAYFCLSYLLLISYVEDWVGLWAVFLGLIYLLIGLYIYRHFAETKMISLLLLAIAAGFVTLAVPLQLDGYWIPAAWAIEAVILFYLNIKMNPSKIPYAGIIVMALSIISLVTEPYEINGIGLIAVLNKTGAAYLEVIAAIAVILWMYNKETRSNEKIGNRMLLYALQITLNLLVIAMLTIEVDAYFYGLIWNVTEVNEQSDWMSMKNLVISIVWGLQAAALILLGFWKRMTGIRWFGLGFMVVVIIKVFLYDLSNLTTPNRIISFMGLGLILLGISWLYHRYKNKLIGGNGDDGQCNEE